MLSIIIPSRNEQFLDNTINDILTKAIGEVEIVVILDGYWTEPIADDRVTYIHRGEPKGMRDGINSGVALAKGKYVMKLDAHCLLDEGFDEKFTADIEKDWVVVPRRKRLDAENWCIQEVGKPDVDHMYLSFPDDPNDRGGVGLHGRLWNQRSVDRLHIPIDDLMSAQGSCWMMHRDYFYELELMDEENYGQFGSEFQEIGLKCWLSGGRVIRNKNTYYAHLHKGKKYGRGYPLDNRECTKANVFTNRWITGSAWHKQTKPLKWLVDKFSPVPGWENVNWDELITTFKQYEQ
jgi:glycosyltransferase involved in cell wall biosynthesis